MLDGAALLPAAVWEEGGVRAMQRSDQELREIIRGFDPLRALLINYSSTAMQSAENDIMGWTNKGDYKFMINSKIAFT